MMHGSINIKSTYICTSPVNGITKLQNIFNAVDKEGLFQPLLPFSMAKSLELQICLNIF